MVDTQHIEQHFRPEENLFVEQALERIRWVEDYQAPYLTSFYNPRQVMIMQTLANRQGIKVFTSADHALMEMQRLILAPEYFQPEWQDFEISLLSISFPSRFVRLKHSQILGTLIHQLGLDRTTFGDIRVTAEQAQFFVDTKLSPYFQSEINRIARTAVTLNEIELEEALLIQDDYQEQVILVSSFRLDKIIAATFKLSRQVASQLIEAKKVTVNFAVEERRAQELTISDRVSVRGYGRVRLQELLGQSKSGKEKVLVGIIKHK